MLFVVAYLRRSPMMSFATPPSYRLFRPKPSNSPGGFHSPGANADHILSSSPYGPSSTANPPPQPLADRTPLPLILQAYPFVFDPTFPAFEGPRMLDDVFPDAPTDVGATITTLAGRPSRAAIQRLNLLDILAKDFHVLQALTSAIANRDLFFPGHSDSC